MNLPAHPGSAVAKAERPGPVHSQQPLFYAALAFAIGIVGGARAWRPALWWVAAITAFLFSAVYLCYRQSYRQNHNRWNDSRTRAAFVLALGAMAALGALQIQLHRSSVAPQPDISRFTTGNLVMVTGHVIRNGLLRPVGAESGTSAQAAAESPSERRQTLDIDTDEIVLNGTPERVSFGLRVSVNVKDVAGGEDGIADKADDNAENANTAASDSPGAPAIAAAAPRYVYGDRIRFPAKLRPPRNFGNPGAFDYRGYLEKNGIAALAAVKAEKIQRLEGAVGTRPGFLRSRIRQSLIENMLAFSAVAPARNGSGRGIFSLSEEDAGLLAAMIIGEQSLIARVTKAEFQRTGVFHILVVSGMNVGILAFVIFWLAKRLRAGELWATLITIVLSLLYTYVTDMGMPIMRAALMLSLYLGARLLYRDRYSLNSIGTAALLLLLIWPESVFEASFQLTFLAVIALGGIAQPLLERTSAPYRRGLSGLGLPSLDTAFSPKVAQFRLDARMISERLGRVLVPHWLAKLLSSLLSGEDVANKLAAGFVKGTARLALALFELVVVTGVMQLALALPMTYYFHRVALMGMLANMVVVPLTGMLMPVGIVATLLAYLSPALAKAPILFTAATLHGITGTVRLLGGVQFAELRVATPAMAVSLFAALAFGFALFAMRKHRWLAAAGVCGLLMAAVLLAMPPQPALRAGMMEVTVIDVGQGDSLLVVSPNGHTLLVDGGGPMGFAHSDTIEIGEDVVSPYLWSRGITWLDAIALTHAHSDHITGLRAVMANFKPRELWVGSDSPARSYRALLEQAHEQGVAVMRRSAGEEFRFGDLPVSVLAPASEWTATSGTRNDESLVLELKYGHSNALLTGDIEKKTERIIAGNLGHVDLLKVAHHGSATSTTPELLAATTPRFAAISVGFRSIYGHPKLAVLERLMAAHVQTYRTDYVGAVSFYFDGNRVSPELPAR